MSKQGSKVKANLPAGGFVALGRDGPSSSLDSSSRLRAHVSGKRDLPQSGGGVLKKPRLDILSKGSSTASSTIQLKRFEHDETKWRQFCSEVTLEPKQLLLSLMNSFEKQKAQKGARLICAAVRDLISYRRGNNVWSAEPLIITSVLSFCKQYPTFITHDEVVEALCSLMPAALPNSSPALSVAPILLYTMLKESSEWPWCLVECLIDDSLHERYWVDRTCAGTLIDNIITVFDTNLPHEDLYSSCELPIPERLHHKQVRKNRFEDLANKSSKIDTIVAYISEMCERKSDAAPRNLLKTMTLCTGCAQIRLLATQRMDIWLLNTKLQRSAMELLLSIACNIRSVSSNEDTETLSVLLKLKALKSKQIINLLSVALKEILSHDSDFMSSIMRLLLTNEFSSARFPYNMTMIHSLFSFDNAFATQVLASEICEMLAVKEEYLKVSRPFLREFVRSLLRVDFDFVLFTRYLFKTLINKFLPTSAPAHLFKSLMDLCGMLPFLAVTPSVREGTQLRRNVNVTPSQTNLDALQKFYTEILKFFEECVDFLISHHAYCSDSRLYVYSFYRLLYLASADYYSSVDNWPLEADVTQFMRAISDAPLSEGLLLKILKAGAEQTIPIDAADTIDLVENLSKRASISSPLNESVRSMIEIDNCDAIYSLFATTLYKPPITFHLQEKELPALSVRTLYWKAWIITIMWASLNKHSLIKEAYLKFPTLKVAFKMLLSWDYHFPPMANAGNPEGVERMLAEDGRELETEKQKIRKLETRLAGVDVDDADSKLIGKLCTLDPAGVCRRPPDSFFIDLKKLNEDLDLSRSLCECRDPDILADIARSEGSACALPAIMNLVESNASAILYLPLECICELFLHYLLVSSSSMSNIKKPSNEKLNALRQRLRDSLRGASANDESVMETMQFIATRLSAHSSLERSIAAYALSLFLQPDANATILPVNVDASPTAFLHMINSFDSLKNRICILLAKLCPVETKSSRLTEYIDFLIAYSDDSISHLIAHQLSNVVDDCLHDACEDVQLHASAIRFFDQYVKTASAQSTCSSELMQQNLPADAKKIIVEFNISSKENRSAEMILSSFGAIIQLLCSRHVDKSSSARNALMDLFFPSHGHRPKVVNADGIELLTPSLRLKMLCAEDERIVNVALSEMNEDDALKMVQSFGLTLYSCTKLFEILDKANFSLEEPLLSNARKAAPFIRAYKRKGALGGDKFIGRLSERLSRNAALKMEVDEGNNVEIVHKPPPMLSDMYHSDVGTQQTLSNEQALTRNSCDVPQWFVALAQLINNVDCARSIIALLKKKFTLLNNTNVVIPVINTLCAMQGKNDQVKSDLDGLCQFIAKKANISEIVKSLLKRSDERRSSCHIQRKSINSLSAEEILKILGASSSDEYDISALISRFLCLCPELVSPFDGDNGQEMDGGAKRHEILTLLFGARSRHLEYLISLMPTRCSSKTISSIIGSILDSHSPSVSSGSVLAAVMNSLSLADPNPLTYARRFVLADYIIDEVDYDPSTLSSIVKFIDRITSSKDELVYCLFSAFSDVLSSSATFARRRQVVLSIIKEFSIRYPEVSVEDGRVKLGWMRALNGEDAITHQLIMDLFESANASPNCAQHYISLLTQLSKAQPVMIIRHLSLISSLLLSVSRLPLRQLKAKYKAFLMFVMDLLLKMSSDIEAITEASTAIESILGSFFRIFDGNIKSRFWSPLIMKLQKVCLLFIESNADRGHKLLSSHFDVISQLVTNFESTPGSVLSDVLIVARRSSGD
ncbi:unnamed protein product [Anisakis simplex]|uniref:DUF3677 domain-containing protein n=1 Tax=Anisakis simplex TaxID=6269 RepID=A0A0M3JSQ2_ANISI|nr:unnamed protein product [Anisakis simplex]